MAPPDAQAAVSYGCSAVLSYWLRWLQVPIDWGQSIYHNDAQAAASYGCSAVLSYWLRWLRVPIDWGQSIYHNDAQRRRLTAVRLFCPV